MNRRNAASATRLLRQCSAEVILKSASMCDGHSILKPEALLTVGLPIDVIHQLTQVHRSDGTHKGTIFVNGEPETELTGIYGLDLLRFVAGALGVEYRSALGRGFEAQNIRSALHEHFQRIQPPPAA